MDEILDVHDALYDALTDLAKIIKIHNGSQWGSKDLWDDKWVDETTLPARKHVVEALRRMVEGPSNDQ